jgi:hypothetical protein
MLCYTTVVWCIVPCPDVRCIWNINGTSEAASTTFPRWLLAIFIDSFVLLCFFFSWGETESTWYCDHWFAYCSSSRWCWLWNNRWNANWQEKLKYLEKTCPSATLFTTNLTWLDPGRSGVKPATNRLKYGTDLLLCYSQLKLILEKHDIGMQTRFACVWIYSNTEILRIF